MTDILARLRSETRSEHEAVEYQLGLVDEALTLTQYRRRLEQFWGFYAPLEARLCCGGTGNRAEAVLCRQGKSGWLEADLRAFADANLASYKRPKSYDFVAEMPRDPSGKLYKRKLRDPYWEGRDRAI